MFCRDAIGEAPIAVGISGAGEAPIAVGISGAGEATNDCAGGALANGEATCGVIR